MRSYFCVECRTIFRNGLFIFGSDKEILVTIIYLQVTSSPQNHTTIQVHHTTSINLSKAKRIKRFLSIVSEKGANLKILMEEMNLRNRSSFVNAYITPNLAEGYAVILLDE